MHNNALLYNTLYSCSGLFVCFSFISHSNNATKNIICSLDPFSILGGASVNWSFSTFLGRVLTDFVSTDASLNTLVSMEDAAISLFLPPVIRVLVSKLSSKIGIYFNWHTKLITRRNVLRHTYKIVMFSCFAFHRSKLGVQCCLGDVIMTPLNYQSIFQRYFTDIIIQ